MGRRKGPGFSKPGKVLGVQSGLLRVEREDGRVQLCRAAGLDKVTDYAIGERVRIGQGVNGRPTAHRERVPTAVTTAAMPVRPLSPMLQRAVSAALAAGETAPTIAARYGLRLCEVHR